MESSHIPAFNVSNSPEALRDLTTREWDVLLRLAHDFSIDTIAGQLNIELKSVKNYCTRIGTKLNQKGHGKLARYARKYISDLLYWYRFLTGKYFPPPPFMLINSCLKGAKVHEN